MLGKSGMTTSLVYLASEKEELQQRVSEQAQNLHDLQAKQNELDAEVRMLRDELQKLRSRAREAVKVTDKKEVLVEVQPEGISVVDIAKCDAEIQDPESDSPEEESEEYWSALSETSESDTSERSKSKRELPGENRNAESELPKSKPKKKRSFLFTKVASALATGATVGAAVFFPATWPVVALNGARVVFATKSIEDNPVAGTIGTLATIGLEAMIPCASSAKYLVQAGKSLHRVKDLSKVAYGAKLLIQTGKSIHRVGPVARYGWKVASYGTQAVSSGAAYLISKSKSFKSKRKPSDRLDADSR